MMHFLQVVTLLITHRLYNVPFHISQYIYSFKEFYLKYLKFKILKLRVHCGIIGLDITNPINYARFSSLWWYE